MKRIMSLKSFNQAINNAINQKQKLNTSSKSQTTHYNDALIINRKKKIYETVRRPKNKSRKFMIFSSFFLRNDTTSEHKSHSLYVFEQ